MNSGFVLDDSVDGLKRPYEAPSSRRPMPGMTTTAKRTADRQPTPEKRRHQDRVNIVKSPPVISPRQMVIVGTT
jgi:hypothetical protein